jgi:hypothetical protein
MPNDAVHDSRSDRHLPTKLGVFHVHEEKLQPVAHTTSLNQPTQRPMSAPGPVAQAMPSILADEIDDRLNNAAY